MTFLIQDILDTGNINFVCIAACKELDGPFEALDPVHTVVGIISWNFYVPLKDVSRLIRRNISRPSEGHTLSTVNRV